LDEIVKNDLIEAEASINLTECVNSNPVERQYLKICTSIYSYYRQEPFVKLNDLPEFDGTPETWPMFREALVASTFQHKCETNGFNKKLIQLLHSVKYDAEPSVSGALTERLHI